MRDSLYTRENPTTRRAWFAPKEEPKEHRIPEWRLQAACVSEFHKLQDAGHDFLLAGDMGGLQTSKSQAGIAKLTGLEQGEPDLRLYFPGPFLGLIEYKAKGGRLNAAQITRHDRLRGYGFDVRVVKADTPEEAVRLSLAIYREWAKRTLH
jgi:hypothetical protein